MNEYKCTCSLNKNDTCAMHNAHSGHKNNAEYYQDTDEINDESSDID